jgi:hypothetical protein
MGNVRRVPAHQALDEGRQTPGTRLEPRTNHVLVEGQGGAGGRLVSPAQVQDDAHVLVNIVIKAGLPAHHIDPVADPRAIVRSTDEDFRLRDDVRPHLR